MTDKVALVTGGGGRFGRILCKSLAQRGCKLIVGDLDLTAARDAAARTGGLALGLDVTDPAMWSNAASAARDLFGPLHLVCHCAQLHSEPSDPEALARLWATQLSALEIAQQLCGPDLTATRGRHVLFVSGAAWVPDGVRPLWSSAEAAKRHWHKAHKQSRSSCESTLIAYDVPPHPTRKTGDDEIAAATLWALTRGTPEAFVPGGFGVAGFCRKAAR